MPPKTAKTSKRSPASGKKAIWRKAILKAKQGKKTFSMITGPIYIRAIKNFCQ